MVALGLTAARLLDPDAYIICSSVMKTHNAALVTLSLKNMVLGAPLANSSKETKRWSDKRKYHVGIRVMQGNMMLTAQKMRPFWGAAVIAIAIRLRSVERRCATDRTQRQHPGDYYWFPTHDHSPCAD